MYKFRTIRRPLLSSVVVTAALLSLPSLAFAQAAASPTPAAKNAPTAAPATTAAPAPKASATATTTAAPVAEGEAAAEPAGPTDAEREAARLSFEAGTKAYAAADYATAASEFKKAYDAIPSPHAEYWIAVSLDKGDEAGANKAATVAAYETFLSNPGATHVGAQQVSESQARVAELKKSLPAPVTIVSMPAGATVTINGHVQTGVTPLTVELPAGTYTVGLNLAGHEAASMQLVAEGGTPLEQQVTLNATPAPVAQEPAPVAAPVAATEPAKKNIVPAVVTLGLGGAGLITGTIFGIMALNSKSNFNDDPTVENADAAERNALIADMSFGVALTLGITGIVLLTAGDEDAPPETAANKKTDLKFAPYASRTGGGATARLTF